MRSRFTARWSLLALAVLLVVPLPVSAADPVPGDDAVLRIGTLQEPSSANPFAWGSGEYDGKLSYDLLVSYDPFGQPQPGFAESWSASPDSRTWTFKIRQGMTWSDGEPADAYDAVFTFTYEVNGDEGSNGPLHTFLTNIIESAVAPDASTLVLTLTEPSGMPISKRSQILPEHVWKDVAYADLGTVGAEPPIVGSGPFILTNWVHGQYQEYTRNDSYWGGAPAVSKILLQFYKNPDALTSALRSGEVDYIDSMSLAAVPELIAQPEVKVVDAPWSTYGRLSFNGHEAGPRFEGDTAPGPGSPFQETLADEAFRGAIEYAIDKQKLVDVILAGHGQPGVGLVAPSDAVNFTGLPDIVRTYDPEEAKRRLDAAGYVDSNGDGVREDKHGTALTLTLLSDAYDPSGEVTAQFVREFLGQVGVQVTLLGLDIASYEAKLYGNDYDLAITGGTSAIGNRWEFSGGIYTPTGWNPPEYDRLKAELNSTADPAVLKDVTAELDRLVYSSASEIVLYYRNLIQAYRTDTFAGWETPGSQVTPITNRSLDYASIFAGLTPVSAEASPSAEAPTAPAPATPAPSAATTESTGDSNTLPIAIVLIAVVAIIAVVLIRRRGSAST